MSVLQIDLLESALDQTGTVLRGVSADQRELPTPCPEFDVGQLVDHLVGWATSFAARVSGGSADQDPNQFRAGPDPASQFDAAARAILRGYREGSQASRELPLGILLMEFVTHGWDLATATGQEYPVDPAVAEAALQAGRQMLQPQYRGPGKTFGNEVDVPESAAALDRLVAFLGRDPHRPAAPA